MRLRRKDITQGFAAGLVGTAGYTVLSSLCRSQSGGVESMQPLTAAAALTGRQTDLRRALPQVLNAALHWGYGGWGGILRALLVRGGLTGWRAEVGHLGAIWLPWLAVVSATKKGAPQSGGALAVDCAKHLAYVLLAGTAWRLLAQRPDDDTRQPTAHP